MGHLRLDISVKGVEALLGRGVDEGEGLTVANEVTGDLLGEWAGLGAVDDNV